MHELRPSFSPQLFDREVHLGHRTDGGLSSRSSVHAVVLARARRGASSGGAACCASAAGRRGGGRAWAPWGRGLPGGLGSGSGRRWTTGPAAAAARAPRLGSAASGPAGAAGARFPGRLGSVPGSHGHEGEACGDPEVGVVADQYWQNDHVRGLDVPEQVGATLVEDSHGHHTLPPGLLR